ncbi:MAG: helix-turn-helix domain-containing protein [Prevotellaceae bacterium]|jgi:transcriptional regulator with XRE-family HTH domain|nr:helix-turn-helix domain-containing protein [Prevotellaceae bacterium]
MDIVKNIIALRKKNHVSQEVIADALSVDTAVISNIENGKRELKVSEIEKIAKAIGVDVLYLITYPDVYEKKDNTIKEPIDAVLQIKLRSDKKEQVLKLIFGEANLEILNE